VFEAGASEKLAPASADKDVMTGRSKGS
jgi:hypothetical protein